MSPARGRIAHLIGGLDRGGAQSQLYRTATALQRRGWPQTVVVLDRGGEWKAPLESAGVQVFEVPRHLFKPWRFWQLRRCLMRERPDLIMSWSPHAALYARWLPGLGRVRRVFNVRGDLAVDSNTGRAADHLLRWYRGPLERADLVVANSRCVLDVLREHGIAVADALVIANIVPARGRAAPASASGPARIVAAGALKALKSYDVLLRALALLAGEGRSFELILAGDGPQRAGLERLAAELGLRERVRFLGGIDDIPGLLAGAQIFAHPSRSESLSNAILEAMAEGLPVVACRVGGNAEIVADGETGLLVPPDRPDLLAAALRRLLDDPPLRARLGQSGLRAVRESCDESAVVRRYEEVLGALLDR